MSGMVVLTCYYSWLRRGLQKVRRGLLRGGGSGGGGGGGSGGGQSGFLTTCVSIVVFSVFYFSFYFNIRGYVERVETDGAITFPESPQPNRTWMDLRKLLLEKNDSLARVVIFGYMRGGSTLFGEIFNQDPSSDVMWHEPMDAFYQSYAGFEAHSIPLTILYYQNYTRRQLDDSEKNAMTNYLENLLRCRPEYLPIETLAHFHISYSSAFKLIYSCMEEKKVKATMFDCKKPLRPICGYMDLIRRDMSVSTNNRCPQLIKSFKSMKNMGRFLVQRLIIDRSRSGVARRNASSTAALSRLNGSEEVELTDRAITKLTGDNSTISAEKKHTMQLLAEHQLCLSRLRPVVMECSRPAVNICRQAKLTSLKLIRTMFDELEATIQRIPDIHVIYYVRDPRAIATSRAEETTRLTMPTNVRTAVEESKILCRRMMEDVRAKRLIEARYPGAVVTVRYEDFVLNPLWHVREIFARIGRPVPPNISDWIRSKFNGTSDNGIYGTVRVNPVLTSLNWMTQTTLRDALQMDEYCRDVLQEFGYMTLRPSSIPEETSAASQGSEATRMTNNATEFRGQNNTK